MYSLGLIRCSYDVRSQIASRAVPNLEEDNRLLPMLSAMSKSYLGQDYGKKASVGQITADMIDTVS